MRGKEHVEVGTEVSDPVHLRHAFELGQEIEEALYLLFVLGSERLGIDREIGLFVSVTDVLTKYLLEISVMSFRIVSLVLTSGTPLWLS